MKQITNKEYDEFRKYKRDRLNGRILTPDGLRFLIEAYGYDAEKIGRHFLEMLPKIREWTKNDYEPPSENCYQREPVADVTLVPLKAEDREQFILDNQEAFNYGALEEFGRRDDHFEEDGNIISRETIEESIDGGETYRIIQDGHAVGGIVIKVTGERGDLDLLFVSPKAHSKGIGYAAWCAVEKLHPEVSVWETVTPYFERRNIHFYVNRCGFHIVEFYNSHHPDPNDPDMAEELDEQFPDGMFRFEKRKR
ncbi:GNAT family N-acetyltransferase [Pseudoramibacter alactolyticus]|uniref:GNAT family N-acetyltransferase n=1 Tax=Pseudoramibacter alactolyticus TaxID=113287 RepID=UPI00248D504B|nr:GNAT family N-acetyltransferase [Pseudoramibacter alactolyticus]